MSDELLAAPELTRDGAFVRLLRAGSARSATLPVALSAAGAVAYSLSLALNWITVTLATGGLSRTTPSEVTDLATGATLRLDGTGPDAVVTLTASNNVTTPDVLGMLYGLGGLALLTLAAAVVHRADLAMRMRPAMLGLGSGLVAVVVATAMRLPGSLLAAFAGSRTGLVPNASDRVVAYQPGLFCALAAIVAPVLAIWLRARSVAHAGQLALAGPGPGPGPGPAPAFSPAADAAEAGPAEPIGSGEAPVRRPPRSRVESRPPNDRTAEPYDLTVTPEP